MAVSTRTLIDEGTAALRVGDGAAARQAFEATVADVRTGAALEGLARARYLERDFGAAVEVWEAAYKAYRDDDDSSGAVRVARTLAGMPLWGLGHRSLRSEALVRLAELRLR